MPPTTNIVIENILQHDADLSVFDGDWTSIGVRTVEEGCDADISSQEAEVFVYVLDGEGQLAVGGNELVVSSGTAITLAIGTQARLTAGPSGLHTFEARVHT